MAEKYYTPKTAPTVETLKSAKKIEIFEIDRDAGSKYGWRFKWTPNGIYRKEVNYEREYGTWHLYDRGESWELMREDEFLGWMNHVFNGMKTEPYEHWVMYVYPKNPTTMNGKYTSLKNAYKRML